VLSEQSKLSAFDNQRPWFLGIAGGAVTYGDLGTWLISRAFRTYLEKGNHAIEKSIDELEQFLSATEIPLMTITALLGSRFEVDPKIRQDLREFAVVMHRCPTERMMHQMVACGLIKLADIHELARKLATFHSKASIASKLWGSPPALARLMADTVAEAERLAADTVLGSGLKR
jgi:aminoglycoside phosphotransferase family enzyme